MSLRLNIIVAVCENQGIGLNGELPWKLREEMKYFSRMTKTTSDANKKNAVIMGRKTWESIPEKFRPLPGRINFVITSQNIESAKFAGSTPCNSFEDAMKKMKSQMDQLETVWSIGGSSIYKMSLEHENLHRIYLTRILKDFKCDTFLPELNMSSYLTVSDPNVPNEVQQEGDIQYKYEVYQKI